VGQRINGGGVIYELIRFEMVRRFKMLSTYIFAALLFSAGFFMMTAAAGLFKSLSAGNTNERVFANSPHSIYGTLNVVALMALFTVAAIFGQAASQDFGANTWMLIFTKNVKKIPYLVGRFLGAYLFSAGLFVCIGLGLFSGALLSQLVDPTHIGPHSISAYVWPYVVGIFPMLFLTGALFFALAAISKHMAPVYVGMVVLVLGYLVISTALQNVENAQLGALADPFGFLSFDIATRYWTPAERNVELVALRGTFLANRIIWTVVGFALLFLAIFRFRPTVVEQSGTNIKSKEQAPTATKIPIVSADGTGWAMALFSGAWVQTKSIFRSPLYWSFMVAGMAMGLLGIVVSKEMFGTATLPVTYQVLELAQGTFGVFSIITMAFYAGELVWNDRELGVADMIDATRVPTFVLYGSKFIALCLVSLSFEAVAGLAALLAQIGQGFFHIEPTLYFSELIFFGFLRDILLCALAFVAQVVINQKYLAHGVLVLYWISRGILSTLGLEDPLVRYGSEPQIQYSDMNGYGHWLPEALVWRVYWWCAAALLLVLGFLFFVRGRTENRKPQIKTRWGNRAMAVTAVAGVFFVNIALFLTYQTRAVHEYRTSKQVEQLQADYEQTYKSAWQDAPQPRITTVNLVANLFPTASPPRAEFKGTMTLTNKSTQPIQKVFINLIRDYRYRVLKIGTIEKAQLVDSKHDVDIFSLDVPLQPGASTELVFDFEFDSPLFDHDGQVTSLVGNGTFINSGVMPTVGYSEEYELRAEGDRKDYNLAAKERMLPRDDPKGLARNYISSDADFIAFEATVSTDENQIVLAPGTVEQEWVENGRRYSKVKMNQPILNFYSVLSAKYEVKKETFNGINLEIYYHPSHTYNLDRMMNGMKDSLSYCIENFGPYQHQQARIIEFPRYQSYAQSFPNTIPYSESIGFIADVKDSNIDDLDYPYYVTAHEIAHQWWAHQVVAANTRGATMTSESMAQYSALMVMKKKFGPEKMRKFLKHELDGYLKGRVFERKKELPLAQNENQQYIHYEKGSLAMYWLQDVIGESVVNGALKKYVAKVKFQGPPYTTAAELVGFLREAAPPEHHKLIDDLFEKIVLFDNRATEAHVKPNLSGGFEVEMKIKAVKYESDESGKQTEVEFSELIEIGAIDETGAAIHLEKRIVKQGESTISFHVESKPTRVGIDPINKLIDRNSDDNTVVPTFD
jgi:ABC-2 type transport system permease protein